MGQRRKPGRGVLPGRHHFNRHQAGKGDQGDEPHQIAQQRAMGEHRVAHHPTGPGQGGPQLAVNDAQQQHGEPAQQPGKDPRRPGNRRNVAGREQPAGTEDRTQTDKGQVHQRELFLEFAFA